MIPWRLRFRGIRDYETIVMDLSGEKDHVLISGPNGAGKSTITFCMGAVLGSGKVDIEGLKSNNMPQDQVWRATIELLFKNAGKVKVDAPEFVQFRLEIEQNPGEPMKKEFYIEEGDQMDDWERKTKFTSGGQLNLTEYKNQVLYKYAVDPDAFYLIWYQKEVNQFAIMSAEERFRIFSEMNGIDRIQKNWEESKELVKETEQSLAEAESVQKVNKLNLNASKNALDKYLDRNRRREEGFRKYYRALVWLKDYYLEQIDSLKGQIEELKADKEEKTDLKHELVVSVEDKKEELRRFRIRLQELEDKEEALSSELTELGEEIKQEKLRKDAIAKEIAEISKQVERIGLSEAEVKAKLTEAEKNYNKTAATIQEMNEKQKDLRNSHHDLIDKRAILSVQIELDEGKEKKYREMVAEYGSSIDVQQEMEVNDEELVLKKDRLRDHNEKKAEMEKELSYLKNNKVYSPRQEASIRYFKKQNIEVYPLRELLELDENARERDEKLFETIKYTLFVNKKNFQAPNDLYHVALPDIVPEKTIMHLPDKHLQVKGQMEERLYPLALKALWWVDSFFKEENPKIIHGQLMDKKGVRGPQEEQRIILSDKVLRLRQKKIEKELELIEKEQDELLQQIQHLEKRNQVLFRRRESLKEAEAFFTEENEREWRKTQHDKIQEDISRIETELQQLDESLNEQSKLWADWKQKLETARTHLEVFERFRKEKEKIEEVQRLESLLQKLQESYEEKDRLLNQTSFQFDEQKRKEKRFMRELNKLEEEVANRLREIDQMERQIKQRADERFANEEEYSRTNRELYQLLEEGKDFGLKQEEMKEKSEEPQLTKAQADQLYERGKAEYEVARDLTGIDEAAPENYEKLKEEFERSENEVKKSKLLLEEYLERMERSKEELENTINTKIIIVNQKFVNYMSHFGFEGKIEWEMYSDRNGQSRYRMFIKARKEGHRGKLEDVNEKARGGKVGKGVSGGEESLSSLLFALALLQTIETSPGYIVLDEFDSALDEGRKDKVFELYEQELKRKMIILTPKSHEEEYLYRFSRAYIVHHNPNIPKSTVFKVKRVKDTTKDLV
ncbi:hypothetical protein ACFPTR_09615 [Aliibacillus thermotolerans]|uniref:Chromosome segregation protein SMC n=1 Tax=Aliibacillus thermotolerans TaxID=1834418 RepID=A0ABW0U8J1_9BACI|nr:hypothetical protein [Aliibacillus thermotolerans]MDA3130263.1 hypothetical protein [Aliibacillus thermotolerans]